MTIKTTSGAVRLTDRGTASRLFPAFGDGNHGKHKARFGIRAADTHHTLSDATARVLSVSRWRNHER